MWPFDDGVVALFVVTLAIHAAFASYVVVGTGFALVRATTPLAARVRSWLPFMLGCAITAGVAPLLFTQLLYQRRFYTANLLLGPRWLAVVPALVVGFYALYLAKASVRWRTIALGIALACFGFVAWSWSELHELMAADATWAAFYAAGERVFTGGGIAPRLVVIVGAMATQFAAIAAWSSDAAEQRVLGKIAVGGRVVAIAGALWLWQVGFDVSGDARVWFGVLVAAALIDTAAWLVIARKRRQGALAVATAAGSAALIAAVVVREAPRLATIEAGHEASGGWMFGVTFAIGAVLIAWVVRTVRAPAS